MSCFVHELAVVESGVEIGEGARIWHWCHVRTGARIGPGCVLGKSVFIDQGVSVGRNCKIQNNVSVYAGVSLGDGVFVGPHVCFTNDKLPRAVQPDGSPMLAADWSTVNTRIEDGASIGANATILCGITLGSWCMVGAGAVVTRSVPPYALMLGNPARCRGVVAPSGEVLAPDYREGEYQTAEGDTIRISREWQSLAGQ